MRLGGSGRVSGVRLSAGRGLWGVGRRWQLSAAAARRLSGLGVLSAGRRLCWAAAGGGWGSWAAARSPAGGFARWLAALAGGGCGFAGGWRLLKNSLRAGGGSLSRGGGRFGGGGSRRWARRRRWVRWLAPVFPAFFSVFGGASPAFLVFFLAFLAVAPVFAFGCWFRLFSFSSFIPPFFGELVFAFARRLAARPLRCRFRSLASDAFAPLALGWSIFRPLFLLLKNSLRPL